MSDTTRSAYRVLETRATLTTVGVLAGLAGLAWWSTVERAREMSGESMAMDMPGMDMSGMSTEAGMTDGLAAVGSGLEPMGGWVFLAMWVTMMVAMMFPTIAPVVLLHRLVMRKRGVGPMPTVAFVAGYLAAWTVAGLVPLAVLLGVRSVTRESGWVPPVAGVVLLAAGVYQFTRWKELCQRACSSPMTFLATHDFGTGLRGTARAGAVHGLYCLGCCWALMAVLFVVGLMNLAWMAAIAVVFLAEKNWRHGLALARVAGAATIGLGVAVLLQPDLLTTIA